MKRKTEAQIGLATYPRSHSYYTADLRFEPRQPGSKAHSLYLCTPLCPIGTSWVMRKRGKVFKAEGQAIAKFQNLEGPWVKERGCAGTVSKSRRLGGVGG